MALLKRLFTAALLICVGAQSVPDRDGSGCLTRFQSNRTHFAPCLSNICFLFLHEKPFVNLDLHMQTEEHQELFPCNDRLKTFPGLNGIAFRIHQEMNMDRAPLCVWAGKDCSFNHMVDFVWETAKAPETEKYQFAISGFLTILPRRVTEFTSPTTPFLESQVIILGPSTDPTSDPVTRAFDEVFHPFHHLTWLLLTCIVFLFILLALIIAGVFSTPSSCLNILGNLFGDRSRDLRYANDYVHDKSAVDVDLGHLRVLHRVTIVFLGVSVSSFVIIVILFYEISVVNFIFSKTHHKIGKPVSSLSKSELGLYSVAKGTAEESVWKGAVDPSGKKYPTEESYPWHRCDGSDECYEKILNRSDPTKYMVTFAAEASYQMKTRQACDRVTMYETSTPLLAFSGGWYVGKAVPPRLRVKIDKEILLLKEQDKLREIVESKTKGFGKDCESNNRHIGPDVIAIPLLFILGPCVLALVVLLCCGCAVRCRMYRTNTNMNKIDV